MAPCLATVAALGSAIALAGVLMFAPLNRWMAAICDKVGFCWHDWIPMRRGTSAGKYGVVFFDERSCVKCGEEQARISCFRHVGQWHRGRVTNPMLQRVMRDAGYAKPAIPLAPPKARYA